MLSKDASTARARSTNKATASSSASGGTGINTSLGNCETLTAGGADPQVRAGFEQVLRNSSDHADDVLAVVEDHQRVVPAEVLEQTLGVRGSIAGSLATPTPA